MAMGLSTGETFELILREDLVRDEAGRPLAVQPDDVPRFAFRFMSGRQQRQIAADLDAFETPGKSASQTLDMAFAILGRMLVGWRNIRRDGQPLPFSADAIEDVLSHQDATQLIYAAWGYRQPDPADLGNSSSPSA